MVPLQAIIQAFSVLRARGVHDPLYCRLVVRNDRNRETVGWLWRDPKTVRRNLQSGDIFTLSISGNPAIEVDVMWLPPSGGRGLFYAELSGTPTEQKRALWFLHQGPQVSGGTHQSVDEFRFGAADWARVASDFFLVRCGSYRDGKGVIRFRHPSEDAMGWVQDPDRFQVSNCIRQRVLRAISSPLPSGEFLTIRRVFAA